MPEKTTQTKKVKENIRYKRDKDREKVKGVFRYYEVPGGSVSFVYKAYDGDPVEKYSLVDGQAYELPLGVAKHLNKNGWYPVHAYTMKEDGKPSMQVGKKVRRFGFQSLEFMDIEGLAQTDEPVIEEVFEMPKSIK